MGSAQAGTRLIVSLSCHLTPRRVSIATGINSHAIAMAVWHRHDVDAECAPADGRPSPVALDRLWSYPWSNRGPLPYAGAKGTSVTSSRGHYLGLENDRMGAGSAISVTPDHSPPPCIGSSPQLREDRRADEYGVPAERDDALRSVEVSRLRNHNSTRDVVDGEPARAEVPSA